MTTKKSSGGEKLFWAAIPTATTIVCGGLALAAVTGHFGRGNNGVSVPVTEKCTEVNANGKLVKPNTYPLGTASIDYTDDQSNPDTTGQGTIVLQDGKYVLRIPDPELRTDLATNALKSPGNFYWQTGPDYGRIALQLYTSATNTLGVTDGCMKPATVNGIPGVDVSLPSSHIG